MPSNIRRFISARTGREFALNTDHVASVTPGEQPDTVTLDMAGKARIVRGSYTSKAGLQYLIHRTVAQRRH